LVEGLILSPPGLALAAEAEAEAEDGAEATGLG